MSKVFITGDRMGSPLYPTLVFMELLRAVAKGDTVATGTNGGIEELVREIAVRTGVEVEVTEQVNGDNGKPDWDKRSQMLMHPSSGVDFIVAIHTDPMESSVVKSLLAHADSKTRLVGLTDLLA